MLNRPKFGFTRCLRYKPGKHERQPNVGDWQRKLIHIDADAFYASAVAVPDRFQQRQYEANDLLAWLASKQTDVIATNRGLSREIASNLTRQSVFTVPGK
ncbi:hypothetical protein [Microvirga rosea]|uniref:hypothetical protein n=1 Tax=Microvirga rosea TaxID=2715425 RepID=UPI001D0A2872|nr:hypothetical protein [Microvirga rosea]MCB8822913.1 hypothetical protein [Microvirga rosea]